MSTLRIAKITTSNILVSLYALIKIQQISAMFCPPLDPITNGEISYLPSSLETIIQEGTMALLKCNTNYIAIGSVTSFCKSDSKWSTKIGSCRPLDSGKPCSYIDDFHGVIHYMTPDTNKVSPANMIASGTKAFFICHPDFYTKDRTESLCFDSKWSVPSPKCVFMLNQLIFSIEIIRCEAIKVDNATVTYSENADSNSKYNINTKAKVKCNWEYVYSGSVQHICMANGEWSGHLGICLPP